MSLSLVQRQRQSQTISPRQLMQVKMLARSLPELRAAIIAEIAETLGFNSTWYFSHFFAKATGKSPRAYRGK